MRRLATVLFALLPQTAVAQTLWALDDGGPAGNRPQIHQLSTTCAPMGSCPVPVAALPSSPLATGDLAYSTQQGTLFVTDGTNVGFLDLQCNLVQSCFAGFAAPWEGMAYDDGANVLVVTGNNQLGVHPVSCPFRSIAQSTCQFGAPLVPPMTGIEIDPTTGNYWVCDSAGTIAEIQIVQWQACTVLRTFPVACPPPATPVLPLTALTVDVCQQTLYIADSAGQVITMSTAGAPIGCCRPAVLAPGARIVGLTRRPAPVVATGQGCSGPGCPTCTPTASTSGGQPTVPNPNLRIELRNAPWDQLGPTLCFLLIDFLPGPTPVPGLCGPLEVSANAFAIGRGAAINWLQGTPPCHGQNWAPMPIPSNLRLCGGRIHVQWVMICGGGGISLSDGLTITVN